MARAKWTHVPLLVALAASGAMLFGGADSAVADSAGPRARRPPPDPRDPPPRDPQRRPPAPASVRVELTDASSSPLATFASRGRRYVLGQLGRRYRIRVVNPTAARVEAVVSVDGLDAIDGKAAAFSKRGYVIQPFADVMIDGFRTSMDEVATFRFASVPDAYAAKKGDDRNVGVIGVAIFREPEPEPVAGAADGKSKAAAPAARDASRPGLGTEFGEQRTSVVRNTTFERATSRPERVLELRYDDRAGLAALGVPVDGEPDTDRRESADPFPDRRFATPP